MNSGGPVGGVACTADAAYVEDVCQPGEETGNGDAVAVYDGVEGEGVGSDGVVGYLPLGGIAPFAPGEADAVGGVAGVG